MTVRNDLNLFHRVIDVCEGAPELAPRAIEIRQAMRQKLVEHQRYITEHGDDMPEVMDRSWTG